MGDPPSAEKFITTASTRTTFNSLTFSFSFYHHANKTYNLQQQKMSDAGRKDFSSKLSEAVTPDSQKTNYDKVKESVTDAYDKAAANITPDNQKTFGQSVSDSIQKGHDDAKAKVEAEEKTWSASANDMLEQGKKAVNDAAEYVSGVVTGAKEGAEQGANKK